MIHVAGRFGEVNKLAQTSILELGKFLQHMSCSNEFALTPLPLISKIRRKWTITFLKEKEGKLGANAMKRVAAGAHLPTPWLF